MKKMLSVALSALLAASLMACGGGSAKGTETKAAQTEAGSETKEAKETEKAGEKTDAGEAVSLEGKTVGFAQTDSMSAWRTTETDSIKKAVEEAGGKLVVKDAGGDIATQESDIRDLVAATMVCRVPWKRLWRQRFRLFSLTVPLTERRESILQPPSVPTLFGRESSVPRL